MNQKKYLRKIFNKDSDHFYKLICIAVPILDFLCPIKNSHNTKYSNQDFIICILDFLDKHVSWRKYSGTSEIPIKGKYLNHKHNQFVKKGVYKEIFKACTNKYLSKGREEKLKYQCVDATFIANKGGSVKNNNHLLNEKSKRENVKIHEHNQICDPKDRKKKKTFIDNNRYNGRKKYIKVSTISDSFGIPIGNVIMVSREHDCTALENTINSVPIDLKTLKNSIHNRYKQNLLADAGYDTNKIKNFLKEKGYTPIIAHNKRNTKDNEKLKKMKLAGKKKQIYKKRFIIEAFFSWIKRFPVINQNYQKSIASYEGLFSLASSIIVSKKI